MHGDIYIYKVLAHCLGNALSLKSNNETPGNWGGGGGQRVTETLVGHAVGSSGLLGEWASVPRYSAPRPKATLQLSTQLKLQKF